MDLQSRRRQEPLVSPTFWPDLGSGCEPEGLHLTGVLSFDDEFRESIACGGIQEKFLLNSAAGNRFAKFVIERQDASKMEAFRLAS